MDKTLPVTILVTSYNRKELLRKTITLINERTFFPFRIIVIDNNSIDGCQQMLKEMKVQGKIFNHIFMTENVGQCRALNAGFEEVEKWEKGIDCPTRPSSDFIVTTQDDLYPPMLGQKSCWLTQMISILEKHEPEYGGICQRIQRTPRTDLNVEGDIIPAFKNFPSVFRLMRRSDIRQLAPEYFGRLNKWESNVTGENYSNKIRKKFGFTKFIYADHAGFMLDRKGYGDEVETFTVADNKLNERFENQYPDIYPLTNEPIKINSPKDATEQKLRDDYHARQRGEIKDPEVTIIVLTCHRIEGLQRILNSVKEKTTDVPYKLLVVVDNDDTEAYQYCLEQNIPCILSSFHRDFVAQANLGAFACDTQYFTILGDDLDIQDADWLSKGLSIFKQKFPDNIGLLAFNEQIQHGKVFVTGLSSKNFINAIEGHFHHPTYRHYGSDRELVNLAKAMGCYHYEESIHLIHNHPGKNGKKDETYKLSENKFWKRDQNIKHYRQKHVDLMKDKNFYDYSQ